MRLLAVSRRSMVAIRRPNRVLEGTRPIDAVLDINVPFSWRGTIPLRELGTIYVYQMPMTTTLFAWQQLSFCIAANRGNGIPGGVFHTISGCGKPTTYVFTVQMGLFGALVTRRGEGQNRGFGRLLARTHSPPAGASFPCYGLRQNDWVMSRRQPGHGG
jgi:hypothetical protein